MNFFKQSNLQTSQILNNFVREYKLEKYIGTFADLPIFFIPGFLFAAWLYRRFKNNNMEEKRNLIYIFLSTVFAVVINLVIQHFVHIKRPEMFIDPILDHIPDASFPSDHAAVSFAFLVSLYLFSYKKIFWIFLPFVLIMNLSRIAGGIHWLYDVLAGFAVGGISAFLIWKFRKNKLLLFFTDKILYLAKLFKL